MKRWMMVWAACAVIATSASAAIHEVSIGDSFFQPAELTIAPGDSVHWTNNGFMVHTVTSGTNCVFDGQFNSGNLSFGQSWGRAFDESGAFPYFCIPHCPGMVGSIQVSDTSGINPVETTYWGRIKRLYR